MALKCECKIGTVHRNTLTYIHEIDIDHKYKLIINKNINRHHNDYIINNRIFKLFAQNILMNPPTCQIDKLLISFSGHQAAIIDTYKDLPSVTLIYSENGGIYH